ncbi:MAG: hypothetical protein IM631_12720 [Cytophagales bacterium]|nr:hypothetical protein [Cytophagales bacterium]MCA6372235.1 hypothetical protein [Cytophagales bacterium]MCA6382379.1 hypothetical protein [Cytophagales bacterium]
MHNNKYTKYKLRAECNHDIDVFLGNNNEAVSILNRMLLGDMGDVEIEFESTYSKDELIAILKNQSDAHVMVQTLEQKDLYTGGRNHSLV